MLAAGVDPLTVAAVVLGLLLPLVAGLIAYIFVSTVNDLRGDLRDLSTELKEHGRQMEGVMATVGPLMWRVISMEDFLEERIGYHPPRDIGWNEKPRPSH